MCLRVSASAKLARRKKQKSPFNLQSPKWEYSRRYTQSNVFSTTSSVHACKPTAHSSLTHTKASALLKSALADSPSRSSTVDAQPFFSPNYKWRRKKTLKKGEQLCLGRCRHVPNAICISLSHAGLLPLSLVMMQEAAP